MGTLRGIVTGTLGLTLGYAVVSTKAATANTGAITGFFVHGLGRYLDPYTPLIPDRRGATAPKSPWGGVFPGGAVSATTPAVTQQV